MYNLRRGTNFNELFKMKYFLFIICFTLLLYQSIDLLNEFMSGKTVTNINYEIIRNTTLPAITICPHYLDFRRMAMSNKNVSIIHENYLKEIRNASKIESRNDLINEYYMKALEMFFKLEGNKININDNLLENLTPFIDQKNETSLDVEIRSSIAHGDIDNDLIRSEITNYKMKSIPMESIRITLYNKMPFVSKCYTLFSHSHSLWNNLNINFKYILLILNLDPNSISVTPSISIPIVMHSPNDLPFEYFNFINHGYSYIIRYSQWNIERLGKRYETDCREYKPKSYTRSDCIFDCYQDKVKHYCQTQDFVRSIMLRRIIYFVQINLNLSECTVSDEIHYESLKSCEDQCHKECHFSYYSFTISKLTEGKMYQASLKIYHNEMPDITIRYIPEMPLLTFICNFGGILGMWLGLSFYTIFEDIWKIINVHILSKIFFTNINSRINLFITQNVVSRKIIQPRNNN